MFKERCVALVAGLGLFFSVSLFGTENQQPHDTNKAAVSNSIVYNLYDSTINGGKGACFAVVATPCTGGFYAPYSVYKTVDLLFKKGLLVTSNATHFNTKSREDLEKETALREFTNRGAKALISSAMVAVVILKFSKVAAVIQKFFER